ncbi:hypothetical protein OROGR_004572 [Orobanche gracilis]
MARKKRNAAPRSKQSQSVPPAPASNSTSATSAPDPLVDGGAPSSDHSFDPSMETPAEIDAMALGSNNSNANISSSYAAVKFQFDHALMALRRGNFTKALRVMKDLCWRVENSPLSAAIHLNQANAFVNVCLYIDDASAKLRYFRSAIECARKAASLSPSTIEYAHYYATLLYDAANEVTEYEDVVVECERALAVEDHVFPISDSLGDENQQEICTDVEVRVADLQSKLRLLIWKSNIALLSLWMKKFNFEEENFWLNPTRRFPTDFYKKDAKMPEERRKEIEVKAAAARLLQLQQKSESSKLRNDGDNRNNSRKGMDSGPESIQGAWGRSKGGTAKKTASSDATRRDWVRSYWNSMSSDRKKYFLRIRISDLRAHFRSSKDVSLSEVLDEALLFGKENKGWGFWACCGCDEKFADAGLFMKHVMEEHTGSLLPRKESLIPSCVEKEWSEMLLNFSPKPLDLNAAIRRMHHRPDYSSTEEKKSVDITNSSVQDSTEFPDVEWMGCDEEDQSSRGILLDENLPLSDDPERAKLLEEIHAIFQALIKRKYLASSHLKKVIRFATDKLRDIAPGSPLSSIMDRTPLCICFLRASELKILHDFLHDISESCGLCGYSEESNVADDSDTGIQAVEITEKIILSPDASFLVFDEKFLPCKIPLSSCDEVVNDVSSAPTPSLISYDSGVILDSDALLSWIFTGSFTGEQLTYWKCGRAEKAQQGLEIFQSLEKGSNNLESLRGKKREHLSYEKALKEVTNLCLDEENRREHGTEFVHERYDYVLKKRREELIGNDSKSSIKLELDAITNVLQVAESLYVNRYGDLESGENDGYRTNDYMHEVETSIKAAIQREKYQISTEISKVEAIMLRVIAVMKRLEVMIDPASSNDYRLILIPLVKSFLRARLEDLAEEDAIKKSTTYGEAFLAELAPDSKKSGGGHDRSKSMHARTRDKKKKNKKSKDVKATSSAQLQDQKTKEILLPSDQEAEGQGSGISVPECDDALKLEEEENKLRAKLEVEERMLEEHLEYQRRIENEAKQKVLTEQHKKIPETSSEEAEIVAKTDDYLSRSDGDKYAKQLTEKAQSVLKDGFADISEDVQQTTTNDALLRTGSLSEGIPLDDGFPPDQCLGGKGPTKLSDQKNLPPTPRKKDSNPGQPRFLKNINGDAGSSNKISMFLQGATTLSQFQAEVDPDEERFQANLVNRRDTYGTGLRNEVGEYNCFLNVIIQSLWHIRRFRDEFLWRSSSEHVHVGDPCVICALFDIFIALRKASKYNRHEAVGPTSLRVALSNLYPDSNFFQEGQMNDATEVLGVIFCCLHQSFTPASTASVTNSVESISTCSCIAHSTFGLDISEKMSCQNCGLASRCLKYTSFFHNINASTLRRLKLLVRFNLANPWNDNYNTKAVDSEKSFDQLLDLVELEDQSACDRRDGGCGKLNYIHHTLSTPPHVFTAVLGWRTANESAEDINGTLEALSVEIDISAFFRGLDQQRRHRLASVVCYSGMHYNCFAYSHDHEWWILYDDETVKVIGDWNDVLTKCERGRLQPQLLLFEAVN